MAVKGIYLAGAGIGSVMLYAGFKGKKWTDVTHGLLSGQSPTSVGQSYPIETSPAAYNSQLAAEGGSGSVSGNTGSAIADDAIKYIGASYVWAGAPGNGAGHWDCSSFVNAVVGRDLHMDIPMYRGGTYHGQAHGPNTIVWLAWPGAKRVSGGTSASIAGDLAIWQTHMGICVGNGRMVSALNTSLGTQETTIHGGGPTGEIVTIKRLIAVQSPMASKVAMLSRGH